MQAHDIAQAYIAAFNDRDGAALAELLHEDVIHDNARGNRIIGQNETRERLAQTAFSLNWSMHDTMIMRDSSHFNVAIHCTLRGTYSETIDGLPTAKGQNFDIPAMILLMSDDDQITQISEFFTFEALIKAVS